MNKMRVWDLEMKAPIVYWQSKERSDRNNNLILCYEPFNFSRYPLKKIFFGMNERPL